MKSITKIGAVVLALTPLAASAQALSTLTNVNQVATRFTSLINTATVLLIAVAVLWIIFNIIYFLIIKGGPEDRSEGIKRAVYGIIGLVIIVSIWGLVTLVQNSFATSNASSQSINNVEVDTNQIPPVQ